MAAVRVEILPRCGPGEGHRRGHEQPKDPAKPHDVSLDAARDLGTRAVARRGRLDRKRQGRTLRLGSYLGDNMVALAQQHSFGSWIVAGFVVVGALAAFWH
jgi:hypothetical protein